MEQLKQEFGKIYDQYVAKIYRFIYVKVNSQETAEDLSSEVFLRAWDKIRNSQSVIENIQAYLYQIARNIVADHYRTKRIRIVSVEETVIDVADPADPVEENAFQNLEIERIQSMISTLNEDYQDLIIWRYIEELSVPEIAQITGKSEEGVRVGVHRALQALKSKLG